MQRWIFLFLFLIFSTTSSQENTYLITIRTNTNDAIVNLYSREKSPKKLISTQFGRITSFSVKKGIYEVQINPSQNRFSEFHNATKIVIVKKDTPVVLEMRVALLLSEKGNRVYQALLADFGGLEADCDKDYKKLDTICMTSVLRKREIVNILKTNLNLQLQSYEIDSDNFFYNQFLY